MLLAVYDKHIDAGGISIKVNFNDDDNLSDVNIEMETSYHGHPTIVSSLNGYGRIGPNELASIGLMFIDAANKLKEKL